MALKRILSASALSLITALSYAVEGPPLNGNKIENPTLTGNQEFAKAQAVGAITSFMSTGAQTCDDQGKNCKSLFGADDRPDFLTLQSNAQSMTGVMDYSFMDGNEGTNSISSQTGSLAIACGDTRPKMVAGLAIRALSCSVMGNGDAQLTFQVCTAPTRGNPISQPDNAVTCSDDPQNPSSIAPTGMVCARPACDTEAPGSLNGWSMPKTTLWKSTLPTNATQKETLENGLELVFYPSLTNGVLPSFSADSDNMTAVKIVQSFTDNTTQKSAVGIKVAYRYKKMVTKSQLTEGTVGSVDPSKHTSQWNTLEKLQANKQLAKLTEEYGANGSECVQQIREGLTTNGQISVCDPSYNKDGIRPIVTTAQVTVGNNSCNTVAQCIQQVVKTNSWTETCTAEVPTSLRNCVTITPYTIELRKQTRVRKQEFCTESRATYTHNCTTSAYHTCDTSKPPVCSYTIYNYCPQ